MAKKNNSVMGGAGIALMAILVYLFTSKKFLIALGTLIIVAIIILITQKRKNKPKSLFPVNKVSDNAGMYAKKIIDFETPYERTATDEQDGTMTIPKKEAAELFGRVLSNEESYKPYENLVDVFYKNAMENKEDFSQYGEEEFGNQITYSFWGIYKALENIIQKRNEKSKSFNTITNLAERLVYINEELFKPFFYALQGFCFWYIYENSFLYSTRLRMIKQVLSKHNGIKQTDFYKLVGGTKEDISFTLYYAEFAKEIIREKSGRSYLLYLPDTEPKSE